MKPGTIVRVASNDALATVVYHNLDGYGVVWGEHEVDPDDLPEPEAMLRNPYPSADYECVGEDYTIVVGDAKALALAPIMDEIAEERNLELVATCKRCGEKVHSAREAVAHFFTCEEREANGTGNPIKPPCP